MHAIVVAPVVCMGKNPQLLNLARCADGHFLIFYNRQDRTATGHILGRAGAQSQTLTRTRNLTPLACGILRCLTHVAMLLGTQQNIQVCQLCLLRYFASYVVFEWVNL